MFKFRNALALVLLCGVAWWGGPNSAQATDCLLFCSGAPLANDATDPRMPDAAGCDIHYPDFCIPPPPPDVNCGDPVIAGRHNFTALPPDPHHLDTDGDGKACEAAVNDTPTPTRVPAPGATSTPTATATATATATRTPIPAGNTPTPTPTPTATLLVAPLCSPRPPVTVSVVQTAPGQFTATLGATGANNFLSQLRFGAASNASVTANGQTFSGNLTVNLPGRPTQIAFTFRRSQAGQPVHVPVIVADGCGDWPTFVGAGVGVQ